jgi:hypothetical protein
MLTVTVLLFLLIVLDIAAMRWGFTSSDGPESREWERRQQRASGSRSALRHARPSVDRERQYSVRMADERPGSGRSSRRHRKCLLCARTASLHR